MKIDIHLEIEDSTLTAFGEQLSQWNLALVQMNADRTDPVRIFAALEPHLLRLVPIFFPRKGGPDRTTGSKPLDEDISKAVKVLDFLEEIGPAALLLGPELDVDRNLLVDRFHGIIEKYRQEGIVVTRAWLEEMVMTLIVYLPSFSRLRTNVLREITRNIVKTVEDASLLPKTATPTPVPDFAPPADDSGADDLEDDPEDDLGPDDPLGEEDDQNDPEDEPGPRRA
jgi:hypothetical protein